jgi:effector-binding domain-containing protein
MDEITIVDVPMQNVLGIRKQGKYELIPQLLSSLYEHATAKGAQFAGMPAFICHELTKEEVMEADKKGTADIEVIAPVATPIDETDEIKYYQLAGGPMAKIVHKGPYEQCEQAYNKLFAWISENGKKISGPLREVYLNDPREVGPDEILTEIYAPVG